MITVNNTQWKSLEDAEKIAHCEELLKAAKTAREKRDFEWYMNQRFMEGDHYVIYNTVTSSIERLPRKRGEVRMVVNKVKSMIRAVQNYSTRFKPKWDIIPGDEDEKTVRDARHTGKVLDYIFRKLHLEVMIQGIVESGLNTSVGWVELDWDSEAEKGLGQVKIKQHDTFDIWLDKNATIYNGRVVGSFMAKTNRKSLDKIKNDKRYDKKTRKLVKSDKEAAVSNMKKRIIEKETGNASDIEKEATIKEFMLWDFEGNNEGGKIQLFTYAGKQVLRDEEMKDTEYPIYCLQIPQDPKKIYHRAWTSDIVPLNKALNRTVSQKIMYVNQALVFRVIAEKGHGVNSISNEQGELLEINSGRKFEQWNMRSLPSAIDNLSSEISTYIEDGGGAHEAALGRMPTGARSGKALEALQAADSNNLAGIRLSLETFLTVIGERVLEIIAEKYVTSRIAEIADPETDEDGEKKRHVRIIGEGASDKAKRDDAFVIKKENELIVTIGSWLGHTKEAQIDNLKELVELGVIPGEEILRQLEFPNVEELSKKAREQRLEKAEIDAEIAGRNQGQGQNQGQAPQQGGEQDIVDQENTRMMNGEPLVSTQGATPEHTQGHIDFVNSPFFTQRAGQQIGDIFKQHIQGELE